MVKTYRDALTAGNRLLRENGIEGTTDARVLLCHASGKDTLGLIMCANEQIPPEIAERFMSYINRRCKNEPVSYITGYREFMGLDFAVKEGILIPRPDTEHTVEYVTELFKGRRAHILDLCTGSGAIAVSLAKYLPDSIITAVDISPVAVEVAKENAIRHNVADRINIICADVLKETDFGTDFDAVVSNPPYIPDKIVETLDPDVRDYEPHLALKGGDDGLTFYRSITENAKSLLATGGHLVYEVGHDQAEQVAAIMKNSYSDIGFEKDLAGINRVVHGILITQEKK